MLSRLPWTPAPEPKLKPKAPPRRLTRDRQKAIRDKIAGIIREGKEAGQPSLFWCEGPARHGIRASLCLQGWSWADADAIAAELVAAALIVVGAKRPTWYEGQPEWTQPGVIPVYYDRCRRCHGPIPEGRRMFCCYECKQWHHAERRRQACEESIRAYQKARYAAKMRKAK